MKLDLPAGVDVEIKAFGRNTSKGFRLQALGSGPDTPEAQSPKPEPNRDTRMVTGIIARKSA
jgi:hypothetical protein